MSFGFFCRSGWNISVLTTCLAYALFLQLFSFGQKLLFQLLRKLLSRGCVFAHANILNCFMPINGDLLSVVPECGAFDCIFGIVALRTFH
jgi:hypothetical protein